MEEINTPEIRNTDTPSSPRPDNQEKRLGQLAEEIVKEITTEDTNLVCIVGKPRRGKTTLLQELGKRLGEHPDGFLISRIADGQGYLGTGVNKGFLKEIAYALISQIGEEPSKGTTEIKNRRDIPEITDPEELIKFLGSKLPEKKTPVLRLDEVSALIRPKRSEEDKKTLGELLRALTNNGIICLTVFHNDQDMPDLNPEDANVVKITL